MAFRKASRSLFTAAAAVALGLQMAPWPSLSAQDRAPATLSAQTQLVRFLLSGALNVGSRTTHRVRSLKLQCNRLPCPTMARAKSSVSCRSCTSRMVAQPQR